ncbi:hypothetical protein [Leeia oryzae]|uniref:hypothetical protein n=1 Tax=Leeia oryzae TaxID=356662 RepID=UPI0003740C30|nr:hypothetical protein [Leeia oryzae]
MNTTARTTLARGAIVLCIGMVLSGCGMLKQGGSGAPVAGSGTASSGPLKLDTSKPQTLFTGTPVKTIFDRLVEVRSKKNMKVKTRSKSQLTMALKLPAQTGKPAEEVRIIYTAQTSGPETLITAKAVRAINPDTFEEKLVDITRDLADKLQGELNDVQSNLR